MIPAHKNLTHPPGQIINHVNLEVPLEKAIEDYMKQPFGVTRDASMTAVEADLRRDNKKLRGTYQLQEKKLLDKIHILEVALRDANQRADYWNKQQRMFEKQVEVGKLRIGELELFLVVAEKNLEETVRQRMELENVVKYALETSPITKEDIEWAKNKA